MRTETVDLLARAMDAYQLRMKTLASNIANLDTPGHERISVSFEDRLRERRHSVASPERLRPVEARVEIEDEAPVLEEELLELADTQMRNQFAVRALREHFALMRMGITGRPS